MRLRFDSYRTYISLHNRASSDQNTEDLRLELNQIREKERLAQKRNYELQKMMLDLEARLDKMKDQTQSTTNLVCSCLNIFPITCVS